MQTLHQRIFSLLFTLIAVLPFASCAQSPMEPPVGVIVTRGPDPSWEGAAAGNPQPFVRNNDDLRTALLTQPVPDIWLEFAESKREGQMPRNASDEKETVIKVVLPPEAKEILKAYWEEALLFDYKEAFEKVKTAQEGYDRDIAFFTYNTTTAQNLQKIEIAAPDGVRKVSDEEANRLVYFMRKASANLVSSAKQQIDP